MRIVAAAPAIGLLAGSSLGLYGPEIPRPFPVALLLIALAVAVAAVCRRKPAAVVPSILAGFAAGGVLLTAQAWDAARHSTLRIAFDSIMQADRQEALAQGRTLPEESGAAVILDGVLQADAVPTTNGVSLNLEVLWIGRARSESSGRDAAANPVQGCALVTVAGQRAVDRMGEWRAGRRVRAFAVLHRPARYFDPGVPDQQAILERRGIAVVGSVKSAALVEVVARGGPFQEATAALRAFARPSIRRAVGPWSDRSAAIVTAIVIGDRSGLEPAVEQTLQEAGTYHVIAISGGNIAILAGIALAAFRWAGVLGRAAMLSAIASLVAYAALVGGGASVDRATLMAVLYFASRALDLRGPPLNGLAVAAAFLTLVHPLAVGDPAFLLTFSATAAILIVVPACAVEGGPRPVSAALSLIVASAATELALLPIGASLFARVTFAGLALNLIAVPLMAVAQLAGMAVVPAAVVSTRLADVFGAIAHGGAEGLVRSAGLVDWMPFTTWRVVPPPLLVIVAYYGSIVVAWSAFTRRASVRDAVRLVSIVAAAGAAIWILFDPFAAARRPDGLRVTFVDAGQGDAALVQLPSGPSLLVDAGGLPGRSAFDIGDRVVAPVLRGAGVRRLDTLVITHGDADHAGGAMAIVNEFRPFDIWEGVPVPPLAALAQLREAGRRAGSRWTRVRDGDEMAIGDATIAVGHPPPADWERQDVRNDDSIVFELRWRDVSVVFTGDVGAGVEEMLAPIFKPSPLRVVKVPHHGSLTSSSARFVQQLAPRAAIVSVGRSNTFGHPAPSVLDRYRTAGAEIFRTDRDGAVTMESDGHSLSFKTYNGRRVSIIPNSPRRHEDTKVINASNNDTSAR